MPRLFPKKISDKNIPSERKERMQAKKMRNTENRFVSICRERNVFRGARLRLRNRRNKTTSPGSRTAKTIPSIFLEKGDILHPAVASRQTHRHDIRTNNAEVFANKQKYATGIHGVCS